jgi:hypothetical protein
MASLGSLGGLEARYDTPHNWHSTSWPEPEDFDRATLPQGACLELLIRIAR